MSDTDETLESRLVKTGRAPEWERDGVIMSADGELVIRAGDGMSCWFCMRTPAEWIEAERKQLSLERALVDACYEINARNPAEFLPQVIAEMEKRAKDADALRGDGTAGKVMQGQAQGYRDAVALLKSYLPKEGR